MSCLYPTMSSNFNPRNPFSSVGLGLGYEISDDLRMFHSSSDESSSGLNHNMIWEGASDLNFDSNLGSNQLGGSLFSHRVTEVTRTFVSPLGLGSVQQQRFHSAIDHISLQNRPASFPLSDHFTVSREVVETTRIVASSSAIFGHSNVRNQAIFPTNGFSIQAQSAAVRNNDNQMVHPFISERTPSVNQVTNPFLSQSRPSTNQVMNPFLTESPSLLMTQEAFNVPHPSIAPSNPNRETIFDALEPLAVNLQTPDHNQNNFNYNMNQSSMNPIRQVRIVELSDDDPDVSDQAIVSDNANRETNFNDALIYLDEQPSSHPQSPLAVNLQNPEHNRNNSNYNTNKSHVKPNRQVRIVELSNDENAASAEYPLGNDGRIHSLLNPDGTYGCPICFVSCDSAQNFGSHVQLHYQKDESIEEKNRRMTAKCRHKKLRLVETSQGVTAVPAHDGLSSRRRKNKGKEKIDFSSENLALGPLNTPAGAAAKNRLLGIVIKEEAI